MGTNSGLSAYFGIKPVLLEAVVEEAKKAYLKQEPEKVVTLKTEDYNRGDWPWYKQFRTLPQQKLYSIVGGRKEETEALGSCWDPSRQVNGMLVIRFFKKPGTMRDVIMVWEFCSTSSKPTWFVKTMTACSKISIGRGWTLQTRSSVLGNMLAPARCVGSGFSPSEQPFRIVEP